VRTLLPEEEELAKAEAEGLSVTQRVLHDEALQLVALAFGSAIILGVLLVVLLVAYAITGWRVLLFINLVVAGMAIIAFGYMMYRRSQITMRL
jgi:hypothetical protein